MSNTYTHRVHAVIQTTIIMDVEAPNDVDSIRNETVRAFYAGEGEQELLSQGMVGVTLFPWLEEGQTPPVGSNYPEPTFIQVIDNG